MRYVPRFNSFLRGQETHVSDVLARIALIPGVEEVDLNYPEHFLSIGEEGIGSSLAQCGLKLHALNMRFCAPFEKGAFTHPDEQVRKQALKLTLQGTEVCSRLGGDQVVVWLGHDGYDYPFQLQYERAWAQLVSGFRALTAQAAVRVSIEYKPYEERAFSLLDSFGTVMTLLNDIGGDAIGITLDFCHMLMKKENPAFAASYLLQRGRLFGVHLNDGHGDHDSGLMTAMANLWMTLELLYYLKKGGYAGRVYFDIVFSIDKRQ